MPKVKMLAEIRAGLATIDRSAALLVRQARAADGEARGPKGGRTPENAMRRGNAQVLSRALNPFWGPAPSNVACDRR